jgi:phosphohistidine swiveling domain-containing protein
LLAWLAGRGVAVPPAVAIPADVASRVAARETLATELVAGALARWLDPAARYAVRASFDAEGDVLASVVGRVQACLDVAPDAVLDAVRAVAAMPGEAPSSETPGAAPGGPPPISVIVQRMVAPVSAGVAFSRNPLTGLDEVVVEAVRGSGDRLGEEAATPERWVRRWGAFVEEPPGPAVAAAIAVEVARETARLAGERGHPLNLAWAHDGSRTWWLAARPLTGLDDLHVYSNRIAREVLPGVVKPLVWSVNVPLVNAAWIDLLEELVGPLDLRSDDLARPFGHRAYFDMTTLGRVFEALGMPRDSLELLLGLPKGPEAPRFRPGASSLRHVPRIAATAARTLRRGRWARGEVRDLAAAYDALAAVDPDTLDEQALLRRVDALSRVTRRAAYANIVVPIVMLAYNRVLERQVRAAGLDPATVDPAAGRGDRSNWDPNAALEGLRSLADALPGEARERLAADGARALAEGAEMAPLRDALDTFVERFGHLSTSGTDFSVPTWGETPDHLVELALVHGVRPEGHGIDARALEARLAGPRRPLARLLWRRAGAFRVYREAVSATYTRGIGLFRGTFLALGRRLAERGILELADDVFYLTLDEIRALAAGRLEQAGDPRAVVARRRAEVADAADLVPPDIVYGDAFVPLRRAEARATLHGIPTSRGSVRGPARVVRGVDDFARVGPGDVIVIPFSDVAWTPLFGRAAGVVAEAGGILSHSSIVAREYGIPCVVSVSAACALIPDGATVVLDGATGTVVVEGSPA